MDSSLTAEAAAQLQEGISLVLSRWAALRMAVENEWGGRDSLQKSQQLGQSIFYRLTQSKEQVYIDDLEDMLDEFMLSLNTEIGDGSIEEIAEKFMVMREECLEGNFNSIKSLKETNAPSVSYVRQPGINDEDDSDDHNNDGDSDENLREDISSEMEVDSPQRRPGLNQKNTMTDGPSLKEVPETVDGWTVVAPRRNKDSVMADASMQEMIAKRQEDLRASDAAARHRRLQVAQQTSQSATVPQSDSSPVPTLPSRSAGPLRQKRIRLSHRGESSQAAHSRAQSQDNSQQIETVDLGTQTLAPEVSDNSDNATFNETLPSISLRPSVLNNNLPGSGTTFFKAAICEADQEIYQSANATNHIHAFHQSFVQSANIFESLSLKFSEFDQRIQQETQHAAFLSQSNDEYRSRVSLMEQEMQMLKVTNHNLELEKGLLGQQSSNLESRLKESENRFHELEQRQENLSQQAVHDFRHSATSKKWVDRRSIDWFTTGFTRCKEQFIESSLIPVENELAFLDMNREMPSEFSLPPFNPDD